MTYAIAVAGWAGAALLLGAYALVSIRKLESDGASFQLLNIVGAVGLAVNAGASGAWASTVVNIVWIGIGGATLVTKHVASRTAGVT